MEDRKIEIYKVKENAQVVAATTTIIMIVE